MVPTRTMAAGRNATTGAWCSRISVSLVLVAVASMLADCQRNQPSRAAQPTAASRPPVPDQARADTPATAPDPSAEPSAACRPSDPPTVAPVQMGRQGVTAFGQPMSVSRTPGFVPGRHTKPALPALRACLRAARCAEIDVVAEPEVTAFQLRAVLDDARAAGVQAWSLGVRQSRVGRFEFFSGPEDISASDVYFGPATPRRISHGDLVRRGHLGATKVRLLCDYGSDLDSLVQVFRILDGKQLRIDLHTGPF